MVLLCMFKVIYMQGDVQMSVSVLLVLGDRAPGLVNDLQLEQWFSSYIGNNLCIHLVVQQQYTRACVDLFKLNLICDNIRKSLR